jgi:hypothetical protein
MRPSAVPMNHVRDDGTVVTVVPPRELTDDIVAAILRFLEGRLGQGSAYAIVFDLSGSGTPNALQRQLLATHMRTNKGSIERWVRGVAMVAPSPLVRGVLTAIFWLEAPPVPHQVFATAKEAIAWASSQGRSKVRS